MTKPRIRMELRDGLADVYAFSTLYNYLIENGFQADISISCDMEKKIRKYFKSDEDIFATDAEYDLELRSYSDLPLSLRYGEVGIDLSILKNCVKPMSEDERKELRKRYKIPLNEKVLVLGFPGLSPHNYEVIEKISKELCSLAKIYFVGFARAGSFSSTIQDSTKILHSHGILKDYYAMADLSLISRNLGGEYASNTLHNFIEATAGGPLFLVKPSNTAQYGYRRLKRSGVIKEAENTEDLVAKVKRYLENSEGEKIRKKRRKHLEFSRAKYLPDLMRLINKLLRISDEPLQSDLQFMTDFYFKENGLISLKRFKVIHPQTKWSSEDHTSERHSLKVLNEGRLNDDCFKLGDYTSRYLSDEDYEDDD
jgi:hypothetical protein